jgi:multiple sugar transport system substrate-binding protein
MESAYGGQMISQDGKTVDGYLNTPQSEQAIQAYIDLYTKDHISPSINQMNGFGNLDLFMTGRVAMEWTGPWNVGEYLKNPNLDFGVAPMPIGPTGKPVTQMFWAGWAVSAKAQHLQLSEELLGFFASQQWAQIDSYWGMPALQGPAADALQQREGSMRTYFSQVNDLQPIISLNTINWVKDCQPPLQDLIENMTEKSGLNLHQQVQQEVDQIDNNLTSTYQDQGS